MQIHLKYDLVGLLLQLLNILPGFKGACNEDKRFIGR
jgi:hypothetical protein